MSGLSGKGKEPAPGSASASASVIRIKPLYYVHVLDNNTNVTHVVVGPKTFTRQEHEKIVEGPSPMITVPPRSYCRIQNPVVKDAKGEPVFEEAGQPKLRHGDEEIRFAQEPFPLYPGEVVKERPRPLQTLTVDTALKVRALRDFTDKKGVVRAAGDKWLFVGPGTYIPRVEEEPYKLVKAQVVRKNEALRLRAAVDFTDRTGVARIAGDEWLMKTTGSYMPDVNEKVVNVVKGIVLTPTTAIHLRATETHDDVFGKRRHSGDEWLVSLAETPVYIPDVSEVLVGTVRITTLTNRQYCIVRNPVGEDGLPQLGKRELRKGDRSFFLHPGEVLDDGGIRDVYVLGEDEALLLRAIQPYTVEAAEGEGEGDDSDSDSDSDSEKEKKKKTKTYKPGDRWMINGPREFIPSIEVEVLERRRAIPLGKNEGVYVRNITTGVITDVVGRSYMLKSNEELWEKPLPPSIERILLSSQASRDKKAEAEAERKAAAEGRIRDKTRVVSYSVPNNAVVQIFDFKTQKSRIVFGPEIVLLGPDEQFTPVSIGVGEPKGRESIMAIAVFLGPDFMTDKITVETSDHARLTMKIAYNWQFDIRYGDQEEAQKVFSTTDFVTDACKALGSRVRAAAAANTFETFHKRNAEIIKEAIFGKDGDGNIRSSFLFKASNLVITNVDIQSLEPIDQKTRDSLQKSVQLAIEITTQSQEARARQEAECLEQEAKGKLELQKIRDDTASEESRKSVLESKAEIAAVEAVNKAKADAMAAADAAKIEAEAAVDKARQEAESRQILADAELSEIKQRQADELAHATAMDALELDKAKELAKIEADKYEQIVGAIGADTIRAIAQAGPEMQAKLLKSLGLKSVMITDGSSPINLFNTASGLIGGTAPAVKQQQQQQQPTVTEEDYGSDDDEI